MGIRLSVRLCVSRILFYRATLLCLRGVELANQSHTVVRPFEHCWYEFRFCLCIFRSSLTIFVYLFSLLFALLLVYPINHAPLSHSHTLYLCFSELCWITNVHSTNSMCSLNTFHWTHFIAFCAKNKLSIILTLSWPRHTVFRGRSTCSRKNAWKKSKIKFQAIIYIVRALSGIHKSRQNGNIWFKAPRGWSVSKTDRECSAQTINANIVNDEIKFLHKSP